MSNLVSASADHTQDKLVPELVEVVRSCGVPFKVSETNIYGQSQVSPSHLTGRHWRKLLPQLPEKIRQTTNVFSESTKEPLAKLVEDFVEILAIAGKGKRSDAENLAVKTSSWLAAFLDLGKAGLRGFSAKDCTPYIHWMHAHLPHSLSQFGGLDKLSGELLEAQNNEIKMTHLRRTYFRYQRSKFKFAKYNLCAKLSTAHNLIWLVTEIP